MSNPVTFMGTCVHCGDRKFGRMCNREFLCSGCRTADNRLRKQTGQGGYIEERAWKDALQEAFQDTDPKQLLSEETRRRLDAKR